jgi:hypothetical protein
LIFVQRSGVAKASSLHLPGQSRLGHIPVYLDGREPTSDHIPLPSA